MRSLRIRILIGYALPIAFVIMSAFVRAHSIDTTLASLKWVVHTDETLSGGHRLMRIIVDAETGQRGFLIGRRPEFLEPYHRASETFGAASSTLRNLVSDNPRQIERIDKVFALFLKWQSEVGEPSIRAVAQAELDEEGEAAYMAQSKRIVDQIRFELDEFERIESELLHERTEASQARIAWEGQIGAILPMLTAALAVLMAFALSRAITRPVAELTKAADALKRGQLRTRAVVQSKDELGQLGEAFNAMADRLAERDRESELLRQLSQDMQACIQLSEAYAIFSRFVPRMFDRPCSGAVYLTSASRNLVSPVASWGELENQPDTFSPEQCWALRCGRPYFAEDATTGNCRHVKATGASFCVPLVAHGEATGVLNIIAEREILTANTLRVFELVAEQLALALANLQLRERLRSQSIRDQLTGLYNRRYLEETIAREVARANRTGQSLGVIMFDVDHFKRLNDTFGHDAGDTVLREIGKFVEKSFRPTDVGCRFGGEEFVILAPDSDLEQVERRAQRLREAIKQLGFLHQGLPLGTVTISLGVSVSPDHGDSPDALLACADAALYRAKNAGRDRVIVAQSKFAMPMVTDPPPSKKTGVLG
jgi:diguanylate cyclase (GGDEF)-like protein